MVIPVSITHHQQRLSTLREPFPQQDAIWGDSQCVAIGRSLLLKTVRLMLVPNGCFIMPNKIVLISCLKC